MGSDAARKPRSRPPGNNGLRRFIESRLSGTEPLDFQTRRRGFLGWHERGYLPHCDLPHVTQFLTLMLADSFPVDRRPEWEPLLADSDESSGRQRLEAWLDRGHGECWLQSDRVAALVEGSLLRFDGMEYRLQAWVLMPNHVHLVVDVYDTPLSGLVKQWKGGSARDANLALGRCGAFWQRDYFDTKIRDGAHSAKAIRYVENNPVKAGLIAEPSKWPWSSARLRDPYNRLPWQREAT